MYSNIKQVVQSLKEHRGLFFVYEGVEYDITMDLDEMKYFCRCGKDINLKNPIIYEELIFISAEDVLDIKLKVYRLNWLVLWAEKGI